MRCALGDGARGRRARRRARICDVRRIDRECPQSTHVDADVHRRRASTASDREIDARGVASSSVVASCAERRRARER